jgi:hypothetical protein
MNNNFLKALCREGVLLSVSIRYWRAQKKLNASDLGINPDKVDNNLISLGHKRLLPKECLRELSLIESRAHALVEANTFPFLNGIARYLPNSKLAEIQEKLSELENEFEHKQQAFMHEYSALRMSALEQWHLQADSLTDDPERLLEVIRSAFPAPVDLPRYFGFSTKMFTVAVPQVSTQELVEFGQQAEIIKARQEATRKASKEIERSCSEFISESVLAMREQTAKLCEEMLVTINGTGSVHQKTLNRLLNFIDQFKDLNFANDSQMEAQLEAVRKQFLTHSATDYRNSTSSRKHLVNGLTALRNKAKELSSADTKNLVANFGQAGNRKFELSA